MTSYKEILEGEMDKFQSAISTPDGDWVVKGFIDVYRNIYTISIDTKVVSKIIEVLLFPILASFAHRNALRMILSEHQNHYPDITFVTPKNTLIALDIKSTYRVRPGVASGFTLGSFTGYFRQRDSRKNISFPYNSYTQHLVLGVIYSRNTETTDERKVFSLENLSDITSVASDFAFLLQEKWRIASDKPGSGNTKNMGSVKRIDELQTGAGPFSQFGLDIFDDYWCNYLTPDMARAIDSVPPYRNLGEYTQWRKRYTK